MFISNNMKTEEKNLEKTHTKTKNKNETDRTRQTDRQTDRQNALMLVTVWLVFFYSMAKPPDWAMESWTALNIKEFTLFDMFQDPFVNTKGGKIRRPR